MELRYADSGLQQLRHKFRPAGLMARADTAAGVAVEVFVEGPSARQFLRDTGWGLPSGAPWKVFRQPDELPDLANLFLERLAGEFPAHFKFHGVGNLSLCRSRMCSRRVLSSSACWSICSMRALSF